MSTCTGGGGKVAFFVGLTQNIGPISRNEAVVFDRIVTNVGSAYDIETGYFTAPFNGTYHFTVVVSAQGRQKVRAARTFTAFFVLDEECMKSLLSCSFIEMGFL